MTLEEIEALVTKYVPKDFFWHADAVEVCTKLVIATKREDLELVGECKDAEEMKLAIEHTMPGVEKRKAKTGLLGLLDGLLKIPKGDDDP